MAKTNKRQNKDEAPRQLERPAHKKRREFQQQTSGVKYADDFDEDSEWLYDDFEKVTKKSHSPNART